MYIMHIVCVFTITNTTLGLLSSLSCICLPLLIVSYLYHLWGEDGISLWSLHITVVRTGVRVEPWGEQTRVGWGRERTKLRW